MADIDGVLAREIGKVAAARVPVGARAGTQAGAGFAARWLSKQSFRAEADAEVPAATMLTVLARALARVGRDVAGDATTEHPALRAVIDAGFGNMNPAVIEIDVRPTGAESCHIVVAGSAKEGLMRQKTAEKAVRRLISTAGLQFTG